MNFIFLLSALIIPCTITIVLSLQSVHAICLCNVPVGYTVHNTLKYL